MPIEGPRPRWLGPAALCVFALSGLSGLIYQSIWSQYLGLYLGHAAYAQCLVLAIFMGGMALGAWWASRRSIHWRNLLRAYAATELLIGLAAAAFHPFYQWATGFAYDVAFPALPGGWPVSLFKWTSGALMILPQSVLLGMTFPLMSNGLMRRLPAGDGAILSGLYFTNSIGAAAGALIATFVLLPAVGLPGAMRFGAVVNIVVALSAFMLSTQPATSTTAAAQTAECVPAPTLRLLLIAAAITGATSFVYEIGWVRMLSMALGTTVHAFELMLAAFIGGLAFGGLWIRRRIDGYASPIHVAGIVQVLMGLAALASLWCYVHSFDWVAWFLRSLARTDQGYALYNAVSASVAILIMAPAAFFAGMTLPLFTLALLRAGGGEASVGRIYAANTLGAIVGVFAAVHALVPLLGLKLAMIIAAVADLALGIVLMRRAGAGVTRGYVAALSAAVLATIATLSFVRFDPAYMTAGVFRTGIARIPEGTQHVIFYRDGKTASIGVTASPDARSIETNGKPDASIRMAADGPPELDEYTMVMAGLTPLALHPDPADVANIGFGSGLTTHTLLGDSRVRRVDTIEIEKAMYDGARAFRPVVERAFTDPRAHIYFEDARTFFASHKSRYDIIVSEPSNPWVSGVASLFSEEFYRFIRRHLKPGGIFVQWLQTYEINDELVATVGNTLTKSFGDYRMFQANIGDLIVVASTDRPLGTLDPRVLEQPGFHDELKRLSLETVDDLRFREVGDRRMLAPLFATLSRRVNSDFHPILSLDAPRTRFRRDEATAVADLATSDLPLIEMLGGTKPADALRVDKTGELPRGRALSEARSLAAALSADATSFDSLSLAPDDEPVVAVIRAIGACADLSPRVSIDMLARLGGATIPYLSAENLRGVWIDPRWLRCDHLAPQVADVLGVLTALSRRDIAAAGRGATASLSKDRSVLSDPAADYLLRIAMLSAIVGDRPARAEQLAESFGPGIRVRATAVQRRYLLAYAAHMQHEANVAAAGADGQPRSGSSGATPTSR